MPTMRPKVRFRVRRVAGEVPPWAYHSRIKVGAVRRVHDRFGSVGCPGMCSPGQRRSRGPERTAVGSRERFTVAREDHGGFETARGGNSFDTRRDPGGRNLFESASVVVVESGTEAGKLALEQLDALTFGAAGATLAAERIDRTESAVVDPPAMST